MTNHDNKSAQASQLRGEHSAEKDAPNFDDPEVRGRILALGDEAAWLLVERDAMRNALGYIQAPTMGLPSGIDPETFAREGATDAAARYALQLCIRTARMVMARVIPPEVSRP